MAGPIDIAYVEILPDLKKFDKQATKEIKAALNDAAKEADKASADIESSLAGSFKVASATAQRELDEVQRHIKEVDGVIKVTVVVDGKEVDRVIKRDVQGRFRDERGKFVSTGELAGLGISEGIGKGVSEGIKTAAGTGLGGIGELFSGLKDAIGPLGKAIAISLAAQFAGIGVALAGAIGPAIVALGASLPAAAGIAGIAIGTLALGFHGLSDALENMDDLEKFNEALKKLSPSARNFVLEIKGLMPILSSIKAAASEGLFRGFEGQLTRIVTVLAGPLRAGFDQVGQSLQNMAKQFGAFITSTTGIDLVNTLFGTTSAVIDNLAKGLGSLTEGFAKLSISATPFIEKLSLRFGEFLGNIGTKLSALADNGSLEAFFDKAYVTLGKVWDISKDVFETLKNVFNVGEDSGQGMLDALKEMAADLKTLSENKTFIDTLKAAFIALEFSVGATGVGIKAIEKAFKTADAAIEDFKKAGSSIGESFTSAKDSVTGFVDDVGKWFSALPGKVGKFFSDIGSSISKEFNKALDEVGKFIDGIVTWFSELPGKIGKVVEKIPGFVVTAFKEMLAQSLRTLGVGIGLILSFFLELPSKISSALSTLSTTVVTFFVNLWTSVSTWTVIKWNEIIAWLTALPAKIGTALAGLWATVSTFFINLWTSVSTWTMTKWDELVTWLSALPGKIGAALSALPGQLQTFFVGLWTSVRDWAVSGWNSVIDWISGVPGRIAGLASNFYNSGINLIRGFFNGIANGASSGASNVGNAVYNAFKSAVNWAIDRINDGISQADSILPGALPRIPRLARGGLALGPSIVGEAGPEVAIPLTGQRGKKALKEVSDAAIEGSDGYGNPGMRMWNTGAQSPVEVVVTIDSSGAKIDEFLLEFFRKSIRVRGGNVQKVLGKAIGGAV